MEWINRKSFAIYFYGCFVAFLLMRYFDGLFLYQISENPIRSPRVDLIVWIVQYLGIAELVSNSSISLIVDLLILILPLVIFYRIFLDKKFNKLALALSLIFGLYVLIIYCFPTLSIRKYLGLVLLPIAFTFTSQKRYTNYLELMRYYVLFIFSSAALWKIIRGVAWDSEHMQHSLKAQHIDNIINWPDHFISKGIAIIIADPAYCLILLSLATLSQFTFVIGFFTKKYDRLLAILLILFIVSDYLVMRIEYWEFIVFLPLFLNKGFRDPEHHSPA